MLPLHRRGHDQVVARRTRDGDQAVRTLLSRLYYRLINRLVDVELDDGVGDFRLLSAARWTRCCRCRSTTASPRACSPGSASTPSPSTTENAAREAGETKWRFGALFNYGIDGVISFNYRPLRLAIYAGLAGPRSPSSTPCGCSSTGDRQRHHRARLRHPDPAIVGLGGLQMMMLGVIGEYLGRIYAETKRRPHFLVKESSHGVPTAVTTALGPEHEDRFATHQLEDE